METPRSVNSRMMWNKSSASWGVSTAVGSSSTRILASPVKGLNDLNTLLDADRQVLDNGVWIDFQVVILGELPDLAPGRADI